MKPFSRKQLLKMLGVIILTVFPAVPGFGAKQADPKAQLKGFSEFITKAMAEWKVPGMAIAIVKDGKVVLAEGFGLRDVKNNLKVTPRTVFAIGSSSKAFTATLVGLLVDEGKLDWDKPVREYLPTFKLWDDFASERDDSPGPPLSQVRAPAARIHVDRLSLFPSGAL